MAIQDPGNIRLKSHTFISSTFLIFFSNYKTSIVDRNAKIVVFFGSESKQRHFIVMFVFKSVQVCTLPSWKLIAPLGNTRNGSRHASRNMGVITCHRTPSQEKMQIIASSLVQDSPCCQWVHKYLPIYTSVFFEIFLGNINFSSNPIFTSVFIRTPRLILRSRRQNGCVKCIRRAHLQLLRSSFCQDI